MSEFNYAYCGTPCHQFPVILCFAGRATYHGESYKTKEEARRACGKNDYFKDMKDQEGKLQY